MYQKTIALKGPTGTGRSHTMTAVLMALMMVFLGGVTASLGTVDNVSTNEKITIGVTDYSSSDGSERRESRRNQERNHKKNNKKKAPRPTHKVGSGDRGKFISQDSSDGTDERTLLRKLRFKANGLASHLRKKHADRLSIPTPETQAEKLARMVKGGAPLKKWVEAVKSEIDFALSVPYQIDYIFHSGLQYGAMKGWKSDIKVKDLMHAVHSVYPDNLTITERAWKQWSNGMIGRDQTEIQNQFVAQTQLSGWQTVQKEYGERVTTVVRRLKEALTTAIEAKGEVVDYDKKNKIWGLPFDGQPGNEDPEHLTEFEERLELPEVQLHLSILSKAHADYLKAVADIKDVSDNLGEMHKDNQNMAKKMLNLIRTGVESAKATRADAVNSLLSEVERLYKFDVPKKDKWVTQSKNQVMKEFREKYTPRAWTATCGEISWHFHSGFTVYFAKPIRVKPVTTSESGKNIAWNVPIDKNGYATVLQAYGGFLYTVENPMERVMRSKPGKAEPRIDIRIPQGKTYLHPFESKNKKETTMKDLFDNNGTVKHRHVCPSHFTGLVGYMGPSNGAFVIAKDEKHGKTPVFGDDYSYSRMNDRKIRKVSVESLFTIDKSLNNKNNPIGIKLRGWWMQSTSKKDVPQVSQKRDQRLPKVRPKKKAGINKQNPNNTKAMSLDDVVKDIDVGYHPTMGPVRASGSHTGWIPTAREEPLPNQGAVPYNSVEEPDRPKQPKKGAPVPALRRPSSSTPATINADLQPFTKPVDYEAKTVAELKELLRAANLKVGGKKAELIERLTANGQ